MCKFIELHALKFQKKYQNKYKQHENVGDFLNNFDMSIGKRTSVYFH